MTIGHHRAPLAPSFVGSVHVPTHRAKVQFIVPAFRPMGRRQANLLGVTNNGFQVRGRR